MQVSRPTCGFSFGLFELDSDTGELRNNGTPVHLQPQPLQVLTVLLQNPGKLVTREELQQRLWPEETFVEFEVGLNQAIKKLREALGDSSHAPLYIETIPRRGYRFISPVDIIRPAATIESPAAQLPTPAPRKLVMFAAIALLLIASGIGLWRYRSHRRLPLASQPVAVVPFSNLTQDPKHDWLVPSMPDLIITGLGQISGVDIISPERLMSAENRLKKKQPGTTPSPSEIVEDAGGKIFVSGSLIRISPAKMVVEIRLQEVKTGRILYTSREEGTEEDVLLMVNKFTNGLGRTLVSHAEMPAKPLAIEEITTSNVAALRHYEAGLEYFSQLRRDRAVTEFQEAVRLDPQFALAHLQLVRTYWTWDFVKGPQELAQAERLKERLSRLRQIELKVWAALYDFDYETAILHLEESLRLAPRDSHTRLRLAQNLAASVSRSKTQLWARAVDILRQGVALDPLDADLWNQLAYNEAWAGNEAAAVAACNQILALRGENEPNVWSIRGEVMWQFARHDEAASAYKRVRELDPTFEGYYATRMLAVIYADQGKTDLANKELEDYRRHASGLGMESPAMIKANLLQASGEPELAIPLLHKVVNECLQAEQITLAVGFMRYFMFVAIAVGRIDQELAFVRQQKLHGKELEMVSTLEAAAGHEAAAEKALQQFVITNPDTPSSLVDQRRAVNRAAVALSRGDAVAAVEALEKYPGAIPGLLRLRVMLLAKDYPGAEMAAKEAISLQRRWLIVRLPVIEDLAHFHLGQVYEATGRPAQAVREYQSFLSHYRNSRSRLPQVAEARAALMRLNASGQS